ncbi:hypothetical protein GGX14DRAFT_446735 [Mycena pura]|uniref:MYND-type domain-containing protein n=1 Tax=Mycena pura TaxID=153505 RepID=A0AAD6VKP9_9AGAR|nr:hypothetical protein GGX14DRAFT_446735 [Mycena pura]
MRPDRSTPHSLTGSGNAVDGGAAPKDPDERFKRMVLEAHAGKFGNQCAQCRNSIDELQTARKCPCGAAFCSAQCQNQLADWHVVCAATPPRTITTADKLFVAIQKYQVPEDAQTCEDYGFNKVWSNDAKFYMACVYQTTMCGFRKTPGRIHAWRTSGTLHEHLYRDIADELISGTQGNPVWFWFYRNVDVFLSTPGIIPTSASPREKYSNHIEMSPRVLGSIASMREGVHLNMVPKNPNTLLDYGFTLIPERDHGMLLAVYAFLFVEKDVFPSDILMLREAGILKSGIHNKMHPGSGTNTTGSVQNGIVPPTRLVQWFDAHPEVFEDTNPVRGWETYKRNPDTGKLEVV